MFLLTKLTEDIWAGHEYWGWEDERLDWLSTLLKSVLGDLSGQLLMCEGSLCSLSLLFSFSRNRLLRPIFAICFIFFIESSLLSRLSPSFDLCWLVESLLRVLCFTLRGEVRSRADSDSLILRFICSSLKRTDFLVWERLLVS